MAMMPRRTGTDDDLVAVFKHIPQQNLAKSAKEGRPIFDDVEICEIRIPGRVDIKHFPAASFSHWKEDPFTGGLTKVTYAERFSRQYLQFKQQIAQTKSGTPLTEVNFLSEARRAEMRALNIYTIEQLANIDGQELKNLGPGGRDFKNKAIDYIEESKALAPNIALMAEIEALRARNQVLEGDNETLKAKREDETQFDEMTNADIKEYIAKETGMRPLGMPSRKTLIKMAKEAGNERRPSLQEAMQNAATTPPG